MIAGIAVTSMVGVGHILFVRNRHPSTDAPPLIAAILAAHENDGEFSALRVDYPYDETIFPPEAVSPTFRWSDKTDAIDTWLVSIELQNTTLRMNFVTKEKTWRPSQETWAAVKKESTQKHARVVLLGIDKSNPHDILSKGAVSFTTAQDPVGAPLFFREVNLPFIEAVKDPTRIRWRFGEISSETPPRVILENLPVCGNCHSFSSDGTVLGLDVDYANDKGSYATMNIAQETFLTPDTIFSWSDYKPEDKKRTFGLLSQVSPDGRYVISTVKDRSVFVPKSDLAFSQLFFPIQGILAVYSRETKTFRALPGADDPRYVQSNPAWSPDGRHIVFARSRAYRLKHLDNQSKVLLTERECREFLNEGKTFIFDLYTIPFNEGAGGIAQPLAGASNNGMSNYFAKYSPDGKWIVFCKAQSFMLLQPDSELYIIPATGGAERRLRCNLNRMNSWHSWSPNSRWLVFSSKAHSIYTQLFLTHIDSKGDSSPPVLLSNLTVPDRAANIPEFVNTSPDAIRHIRERFINDISYMRVGEKKFKYEDPHGAIEAYHQALRINPENTEVLMRLSQTLYAMGNYSEAKKRLLELVGLETLNVDALCLLGATLVCLRKDREAMTYMRKAVAIDPKSIEANYNLGSILTRYEKWDEGLACLRKAVELGPGNFAARYNYGVILLKRGRTEDAIHHLLTASRINPDFDKTHCWLGMAFNQTKQYENAEQSLLEALRLAPTNGDACSELGWALFKQKKIEASVSRHELAFQLAPRLASSTKALMRLAVAYGAAGEFSKARSIVEKAIGLAEASGDTILVSEFKRLIELYKQGEVLQGR